MTYVPAGAEGGVFVRVISLEGPPIENTALTIDHTGWSVGNFDCGSSKFEIANYSSSQGYVKISEIDGLPSYGSYEIGFEYTSAMAGRYSSPMLPSRVTSP